MEAMEAVLQARELLRELTPLRQDCGRYCGGACCQSDEDGQGGMLLFPGEEALYRQLPEGFSIAEDRGAVPDGKLLVCGGFCRREDRPLSCRLFPLLPTRRGACLDRRAWSVCPLMDSGVKGLAPEFVAAVKQAGRLLYSCQEHAGFLDAVHAYNERLKCF